MMQMASPHPCDVCGVGRWERCRATILSAHKREPVRLWPRDEDGRTTGPLLRFMHFYRRR